MVPKMQTSVGIACFESYHSRSRLLLRSAASLLQTLSLPLPGALSSSRLSPPPRLPSLSPSLVLRPPLTVTGWLVDWLFLGGGREGGRETTASAPLARGRGRRARGLRQLTHIFPIHLQARLARFLPFLPQSLGEALPLRFASFLPLEDGEATALATKATAVERELEQTHSRAGIDAEVREGPRHKGEYDIPRSEDTSVVKKTIKEHWTAQSYRLSRN